MGLSVTNGPSDWTEGRTMSSDWESAPRSDAGADSDRAWWMPDPVHPYGPQDTGPVPPVPPMSLPAMPSASAPAARHRRRWVAASAAAAVLVMTGAGVGLGVHAWRSGSTSANDLAGASQVGSTGGSGTTVLPSGPDGSRHFGFGRGTGDLGGTSRGGGSGRFGGQNPSGGSTTAATTSATAAQQVGIVDINTVLGLQSAKAAGTGMVLTSSGEILTNNHVVSGATSITVTVVTAGRTYAASVVGYDATQDVAVLRLTGASGLATVNTSSALQSVGASVVGVGNAGGSGGTPSAAPGTVLALDQTITATDENGSGSEQLIGLIETDAPVAAGDSGGPLFDSGNQVVGMDTAASVSGASQAFAIPIGHALAVASLIAAGQASSTVHIGATAFLGVEVQGRAGAEVAAVVPGSPAAVAGLAAGDVITAVGRHAVPTAASLSIVLQPLAPGQRAVIDWTDAAGAAHRATVALGAGPAL